MFKMKKRRNRIDVVFAIRAIDIVFAYWSLISILSSARLVRRFIYFVVSVCASFCHAAVTDKILKIIFTTMSLYPRSEANNGRFICRWWIYIKFDTQVPWIASWRGNFRLWENREKSIYVKIKRIKSINICNLLIELWYKAW
jgi:hypothetical protein